MLHCLFVLDVRGRAYSEQVEQVSSTWIPDSFRRKERKPYDGIILTQNAGLAVDVKPMMIDFLGGRCCR